MLCLLSGVHSFKAKLKKKNVEQWAVSYCFVRLTVFFGQGLWTVKLMTHEMAFVCYFSDG